MIRTRRRFVPRVISLEGRQLLASGPSAVWLGQDGHDYAGGAQPMAGNGVQDVHILLSGLPTNHAIRSISIVGDGGAGWVYDIGPYYASTSAALVQPAGSATADLYVDPYRVETGRGFTLSVTYDDSSTSTIAMQGGTADPNLRMPTYAVSAAWLGQDGPDLTGPTPAVGPDGHQDVQIALSHLFPGTAIASVTVTDGAGHGWASGTNPGLLMNAEFVVNPSNAGQGDLDFSPTDDLAGRTLAVTVTYADGKVDHTTLAAGHTDPNLPAASPPAASVAWNVIQAAWLGQDGLNLVGPGDVHLSLAGLPAGRSVVSATVSDESGVDWTYLAPGSGASSQDPSAQQLGFRARPGGTAADLSFPPLRDETGATLTVTVTLDNGAVLAARVAGQACDIGLRRPDVAATSTVAHPGDDLNTLANEFGHVRLVAGTYPMSAPLILNHPVTITADPGVTLLFSQAPGDAAWTAAIKVRASHTTLEGFAVRFSGPVRWDETVPWGPAVVASSAVTDPWNGDPLIDLTFNGLDIQAPPASTSWEEAPRTFELATAESGTITNNTIKGGMTEVTGGPWAITGNNFLGTQPDTFVYCAFATHGSHDVTIAANTVVPTGPSGKTWRFLVMTQSGFNDTVSGNTVAGVGPMDTDTVPNPNASEIILTEAYRVHYEGLTSSVSPDGMLVQIPTPQGGAARTGDVLAILSGPQAGQWRRIAQVLSPTAYLLDAPVTPGSFAVSLDTGFVGEQFLGNTVDARGSSTAGDLVLVGNQFGLEVVGNHFLGGNMAFKITAAPSEQPVTWGWTHAPLLGATIASNTIQDTELGGLLDVEHNTQYIKSDAGRVYFSGTFANNTGIWSAAFLAARANAGIIGTPAMVTVGDALSGDPGELLLSASGNTVQGPTGVTAGQVVAGTVNGVARRNVGLASAQAASPQPSAAAVSTKTAAATPAPATTSAPKTTPTPSATASAPVSKPVVSVTASRPATPAVPVATVPKAPVVATPKVPAAVPVVAAPKVPAVTYPRIPVTAPKTTVTRTTRTVYVPPRPVKVVARTPVRVPEVPASLLRLLEARARWVSAR